MTKEDLLKDVLKKQREMCPFTDEDLQNGYREGFLDGFNLAVEKLQSCGNCQHDSSDPYGHRMCELDNVNDLGGGRHCYKHDKWEISDFNWLKC